MRLNRKCKFGSKMRKEVMDKQQNALAFEVLEYYRNHRRILPWRENPQPYYIWLSEVMLQQTRVDTVIPYFERFISTLPDIAALSEAKEEVLLKLWEGLGYYSRVRNLQKAAKMLVTEYGGKLPSEKRELMKLPGIGAYTAGAISSIAFGKKETAVDGNLIRIGSRLMAYEGSISNADGKKKMEEFWEKLLPEEKAGDFNQAVMDIGARICLPNSVPLCDLCPLNTFCTACQNGNPMDYPKKELKKARKVEEKTVFLLFLEDRIALEKREDTGLLAGMWQFPMTTGHLSEEEALKWIEGRGLYAVRIQSGPSAKHIFSHIEWRMVSWQIRLDPFRVCENCSELFWTEREQIDQLALPTAFKRYREEARHLKRYRK